MMFVLCGQQQTMYHTDTVDTCPLTKSMKANAMQLLQETENAEDDVLNWL